MTSKRYGNQKTRHFAKLFNYPDKSVETSLNRISEFEGVHQPVNSSSDGLPSYLHGRSIRQFAGAKTGQARHDGIKLTG
ncbi:MAG: hypothetical protein ACJA2B_000974 [Candidatus Endobugula sp.]|jgi:hypothetical protein